MAATFYEITVGGALGPAVRQAFADMQIEVKPALTVLSGDLEQRALHALLDRICALGLELVEVRQGAEPRRVERPATDR